MPVTTWRDAAEFIALGSVIRDFQNPDMVLLGESDQRAGEIVAGIYRRSIILASGRYAMLDDGIGFRLVPWRPVIEQRLGQLVSAIVRGRDVTWQLGRQRGLSV